MVQEWSTGSLGRSVGPPRGPEVVGGPSQRTESSRKAPRSGRKALSEGRKALSEDRDALPEVREWSGGPPSGLGVLGRPTRRVWRFSRRSGSDLEVLPEVREWSGGSPGGPGVVWRFSRRSGSGRESLPVVPEWLGVPPGGPGVFGRFSRMSGIGWEALPEVRIVREVLPVVQECSGGPRRGSVCPTEGSEVIGGPSKRFGRGREALTMVQEW